MKPPTKMQESYQQLLSIVCVGSVSRYVKKDVSLQSRVVARHPLLSEGHKANHLSRAKKCLLAS